MILFITALDQRGVYRSFSFQPDELETGFDRLSTIVGKGYILLKVELGDADQFTLLPIDAFDGDELSTPIRTLEIEWQEALNRPVDR